MKTQTIINIVFAVAFVGYVVSQRNPTFDTITCKTWNIVDADGKKRITALSNPDGQASVVWFDKDEKGRLAAYTTPVDGQAGVLCYDKDGKVRISAATLADGTVVLPTEDLNPPKKP